LTRAAAAGWCDDAGTEAGAAGEECYRAVFAGVAVLSGCLPLLAAVSTSSAT